MVKVTLLGVADPDGIERLHLIREGHYAVRLRPKGVSHHRWTLGLKRGVRLNGWGMVVG
jgi:hypothetical protein